MQVLMEINLEDNLSNAYLLKKAKETLLDSKWSSYYINKFGEIGMEMTKYQPY